MNEQNIDKLFKKKLGNYSMTPSTDASNKLNNMFAARRRRIAWKFARFAATILLVAISLYAINRWSTIATVDAPEPITKTIKTPGQELPAIDSPIASVEEEVTDNSTLTVTENTKTANKPSQETLPQSENNPPVEEKLVPSSAIAVNSIEPTKLEKQKITEERELAIETEAQTRSPEPAPAPIRQKVTITYKKSSNPTDAMLASKPEPKQQNDGRLKRIWKNLNPGDISLAGFRTTKDQILVINKRAKDNKSN